MLHSTLVWLLALGTLLPLRLENSSPAPKKKPNIIYIFTDQQHRDMMSAAGNPWLKTPAMDYLAANGVRFTRAYTTNPVCAPARVSLMTGRMPGYFKDNKGERVTENVGAMRIGKLSPEVENTTLAAWLKRAGYRLLFGGKEHLPPSLTPKALGFEDITDDERGQLAERAAEYITSKPEDPYFMVVSLINPHDICYMAIRDFASTEQEKRLISTGTEEIATLDRAMQRPAGVSEAEFFRSYCPPLPPNFEPQRNEPRAIKNYIASRNFQQAARNQYTDKDWRTHRWAYCRLTETVDSQIQTILNALRESGQEENTLILYSSDHGDMDAAHRLEHKSLLYEESAGVPFLAMWKGHLQAGVVDSTHLVSSGLDLLPTVCDFAGIKAKADLRGRSLRPLLEGKKVPWRQTLGVESAVGRMVVDDQGHKYIRYEWPEGDGTQVQLLDLNRDPYEMTHFTDDPGMKAILVKLSRVFDEKWFPDR
ncbi:sulfatase [Persicitalea sp.]|uniref:sulfatase family protein n=1 Tax=Persicitalea sp. TaxID=3100273 RepID=UPI0035944BBF